jgi:hypothetical protein
MLSSISILRENVHDILHGCNQPDTADADADDAGADDTAD